MTVWTVRLQSVPTEFAGDALEEAMDALVTALEDMPEVRGPVVHGDIAERWVSARFWVDGESLAGAVAVAEHLFVRAAHAAGMRDLAVAKVEVGRGGLQPVRHTRLRTGVSSQRVAYG